MDYHPQARVAYGESFRYHILNDTTSGKQSLGNIRFAHRELVCELTEIPESWLLSKVRDLPRVPKDVAQILV